MSSFCLNWNAINNKPALRDGCHRCLCFSIMFLSQMQLWSLFWRIERRCNFHLPFSGCGADVGPAAATSLRRLPLYKQVCFQLSVFRVGSPLEPMKDTDAVSCRLLCFGSTSSPGWKRVVVSWNVHQFNWVFESTEMLFNWWRSLLHSVISNQCRLISARPKTPSFLLASLGGF